ncbi:PDZ domain-containing protein [Streptomyces violaceusniger]|uniref:PDZ/DHR/GLGF domain protein n=1 Tax=Streptomyces violaceusniger (strain Tu 4113) TaxID=653045 RepID=G2P7X8_STRV4|nr:PDZ domain-containing protein [Streptomyces violaceusniger]AEM85639.1 PDZ/DHR/GLGF domain protein [Streptomyces violaceusniger Tu 4113]
MIRKFARVCSVLALGTAMLAGAVAPAVASAASASASEQRQVRSLPPQQNVPSLDAGGPAGTVAYPPDGQRHFGPGSISVQAPPHTRITGLDLACTGMACPVSIAADGKSATAQLTGSVWDFIRPFIVNVVADIDAPLAGGTFSGTFTLDGVTQPLTVNITPGIQGIIAANLRNTSPAGGGVRVLGVDPGSNTDAAGLLPGDVIVEVAGTLTPTVNDLDTVLSGKRSGATYPVTVRRGGALVTLQIPLDPEP